MRGVVGHVATALPCATHICLGFRIRKRVEIKPWDSDSAPDDQPGISKLPTGFALVAEKKVKA
jgi:hypothetical protein